MIRMHIIRWLEACASTTVVVLLYTTVLRHRLLLCAGEKHGVFAAYDTAVDYSSRAAHSSSAAENGHRDIAVVTSLQTLS